MNAADRDRRGDDAQRLLVVDPRAGAYFDATVGELPWLLHEGDLLVVNDAATFPASLPAIAPDGAAIEARLAAPPERSRWAFVLFGAGDWRADTDHRPAPPRVEVGDGLAVAGLRAHVDEVSPRSPRLVSLRFAASDTDVWSAIYRPGRPVPSSYLREPLDLGREQTRFSGRP
jgi:S-adenosylmethionine:tRNA ribosyltransferase-isomerase